eukprot:262891_1
MESNKRSSGRSRRTASARSSRHESPQGRSAKSKISVCVRKRPISSKEVRQQETDITSVTQENKTVTISEQKTAVDLTKYTEHHQFVFDYAFPENSSNERIYAQAARPLVDKIFDKGHATCFAYGQTGSGKTHTMLGPDNGRELGIYALAVKDIFRVLEKDFQDLSVVVSFFEIYGGKLYDLLNGRRKLLAREDARKKVVITGLQEHQCQSAKALMSAIAFGSEIRSTGQTGANIDSSRSHAVLRISLKETAAGQGGRSTLGPNFLHRFGRVRERQRYFEFGPENSKTDNDLFTGKRCPKNLLSK